MTNFNYEDSYGVGISFYFWIMRLVNTQLALYSHVRCNPLHTPDTPETPPKHLHMTMTNFSYELSYLPGVICIIVVKANLGRSTPPPNALWDIYYGMYLAAILDSSSKGGNIFYFWKIGLVNSQLALYSLVRCNTPQTPPHDNEKFHIWQLQISTMRAHICQV